MHMTRFLIHYCASSHPDWNKDVASMVLHCKPVVCTMTAEQLAKIDKVEEALRVEMHEGIYASVAIAQLKV